MIDAPSKSTGDLNQHEHFMRLALEQARAAAAWGDVPIGAVIMREGHVIAAAGNRRAVDADPTAHAEMLAIRAAAQLKKDWRLEDCTLYVTLEPCVMCAGAIILARLPLFVYGARPQGRRGGICIFHPSGRQAESPVQNSSKHSGPGVWSDLDGFLPGPAQARKKIVLRFPSAVNQIRNR